MRKILLPILILLAAAGYFGWHYSQAERNVGELELYGNVDIRQVSLAFTQSERIDQVLAEEGDQVKEGQLLASLDTRTLALQVKRTEAAIAAQQQQVAKLHNGSRPEEIAQAAAQFSAAEAELELAQSQLNRLEDVKRRTDGRGVSAQDIDSAATRVRAAKAQLAVQAEALKLAQTGPRDEDIAAAEAQLETLNADLALLNHQLDQSRLIAPTDARVRARLLEPGDIASPQRPVFTLALNDPKWVRVYVSEPDMGHLKPGMQASIYTDSFPEQPVAGTVGYISSVAEFTPKNVQTESLRTALVYEVRVLVDDPDNRLRMGMPATVSIDLNASADTQNGQAQ
ncbi:HlyD family efflux transporter periplasmic adaptor subunit [Marinobacterium mangrovicola]|uniref:HlyD family secretion protein n=1 Tax=Marinobacterium mangrovicola TaxID=1476959 RepID=A0A4R1GCN7_9GAMM|nr:HlyD family efflux transporter periplasmic adaptor subunit [Marinobacterium mangrovicola]TCK05804.1 HlyD family secretion protein [Marinobacterium mangrovicola]